MRALDFLVDLLWLRVPLLARRVTGALSEPLVDGQYLVAWRPLAAAAPPLALLVGFWIGSTHWTYRAVFTESLSLLMLAVVVGVASSYLGVLFVLGFAVGDYLLMTSGGVIARGSGLALHLPMVRLALFIEYGLLALLVVSVPMGAKALMAQLRLPRLVARYTAGRYANVLLFAIGFPALVGVGTYLWQQSGPLLIRPVYTWSGGQPTSTAMVALQRTGLALAHTAAIAALARVILEGLSLSTAGARTRIQRLHARLGAAAQRITPLGERVNPWVPTLLGAAWATFMLSGPVESPEWQYLLFGVILLLGALRSGALPVPLGPWPRIAARIPLLLRIGATIAIVFIISQNVLLGRRPEALGNLRVFVFITVVSLVVSYVFNPGLPKERRRPEPGPAEPVEPAAAPSPATSAASLVGLLLPALGAALLGTFLFPELALADNCSGDSDCFGTARGMVAPAAATGTMALFLSGARRWLNRGVSAALHLNPVTGPLMWGYGFVTGKDFWTGERTYFDLEWAKNVPEAFWEDYASGQALKRLEAFICALPKGFQQGFEGTVKALETAGKFWSDAAGDPGKLADAMKAMPDAAVGAAGDMVRLGRQLEAAATAQDTTRFGELMGQMTGNAMFQALLAKGQAAALDKAGQGLTALRGTKATEVLDGVPTRAPTPPREMPAIQPSATSTAGRALDTAADMDRASRGPRNPALNQGGVHRALPPEQPAPPRPAPPKPQATQPAQPTRPAAPAEAGPPPSRPHITPDQAKQNVLRDHGDVIPFERQQAVQGTKVEYRTPSEMKSQYAREVPQDPKPLPDTVRGWQDPNAGKVVVDPVRGGGGGGTLQHEVTHAAQNPSFKQQLGRQMNEGACERYTRPVTDRAGIDRTGHYDRQMDAVQRLEGLTERGPDLMRGATFGEGNAPVNALRQAIDTSVGREGFLDAVTMAVEAQDFGLANRLLSWGESLRTAAAAVR